jgi:hypothetical protein
MATQPQHTHTHTLRASLLIRLLQGATPSSERESALLYSSSSCALRPHMHSESLRAEVRAQPIMAAGLQRARLQVSNVGPLLPLVVSPAPSHSQNN